jgi:hypothetical protein
VHAALDRRGGAVRISSDLHKDAHRYYQALVADDADRRNQRAAGHAALGQTEVGAYVRELRFDAVVETSLADLADFRVQASAYRQAGYRIEFVVLAVRAADSRQGTAARYATVTRSGLPGRFTTGAGHDTCYTALADAVHAAQAVADREVVVVRRDGAAVYRNHRTAAGVRAHPAHAACALVAEQNRPYTEREAYTFLTVQRQLCAALPQYRVEIQAISRLARPLLPAHLQARSLARPAPPTALPVPAGQVPARYWVSSRNLDS